MLPQKLTKQAVCLPDYPVVETKQGRLRGIEVESAFSFRGIRYAKAKRFHMPEEPDSWEGIKNATAYGPCCREISTLIPQDAFTVPHFWYPQDEDCQYLNIWTQTLDKNAACPVMVWIHGGGMHHGSGYEIYSYDGEELSRFANVVTVTLNHRLNVLGYCDLSAWGDEYKYSGNLGAADLVAALKWIHENIAAFGGDPNNVTIMGQSGGGMKVLGLTQTPAADGLFHRAIMQSGVSDKAAERYPDEAEEITKLIMAAAGVGGDAKQLEALPFHTLALAVGKAEAEFKRRHNKRMAWSLVTDRDYYMGHPGNFGFRKENYHIPMIAGTVLGEFTSNTIDPRKHLFGPKNKWSEETLSMRLRERFGEDADAMRSLFEAAYPDHNPADVLFMDFARRAGHLKLMEMRSLCQGAAPAYNYVFSLDMPADGGSTAWHNAEESFMFHNASFVESAYIPGVTEQLEDAMAGAWAAFAAGGDPNHPGLPTWAPVVDGKPATMVFDRKCEMKYGYDDALYELGLKMPDAGFNDGPKVGRGGSPRVKI